MKNEERNLGDETKGLYRAKRLTPTEIMIAVQEVIDWMTRGDATRTIIKRLSEKDREYTQCQIRTIMEKAAIEIKDMYKDGVATIYERALNRLELMYEKCMSKGNYKIAIEVQKEIDRISGLHNNRLEIKAELKIPDVIKINEIRMVDEGDPA